jgi:hypothetical protein
MKSKLTQHRFSGRMTLPLPGVTDVSVHEDEPCPRDSAILTGHKSHFSELKSKLKNKQNEKNKIKAKR